MLFLAAAAFAAGAPLRPPEGVLSTALLPQQLLRQQAPQAAPPPADTPMAQSVADISEGLQLMQDATSHGAPAWPLPQVCFTAAAPFTAVLFVCESASMWHEDKRVIQLLTS